MNVILLCTIILLTTTWIILSTGFSIMTLIAGILISAGCIYVSYRLLPMQKIENIKIIRFTGYLFYLFIQIYVSAFKLIRLIFIKSDVEVVEIKTEISNNFLQTVLANSITLVPGSVSLELKDKNITVLRIKKKTKEPVDSQTAGELLKGRLERKLLKTQK